MQSRSYQGSLLWPFLALALILISIWIFARPLAWALIVIFGFIVGCFLFVMIGNASLRVAKQAEQQKPRNGRGGAVPTAPASVKSQKLAFEKAQIKTAIRQTSVNSRKQNVAIDRRFALIDSDGQFRYAQILDGTFQVGKAREQTPRDLTAFARAILVEQKGGRFTTSDGVKHGILGFGGRAREARGYVLDAGIALAIGVPPRG